ncbi:MAG: LysM peptidoglycan-binding domain-containing protein [bacterium]
MKPFALWLRSHTLAAILAGGTFLAVCGPAPSLAISPADKGSIVTLPVGTYGVQASFEYEVQAGDDLHWLAASFYGDARQWGRIYNANRDVIRNPNLLRTGQKLTIPSNGVQP